MTVDLPPVPPPSAPASEVTADPVVPRPVPARLTRLASHHPLVIAAIIVSVTVSLVTVALSLAAFAARSWWVFDILTSYRPQFTAVLLVAVVLLAALRCWKTLIVAVLALGLNAAQVAPVFLSHQAAPRSGSPTLTIAHLNLQSRTGNIPEMRTWLETKPADLVVFLHAGAGTANDVRRGIAGYRMIFPEVDSINAQGHVRYDPSPELIVLSRRPGVYAEHPDTYHLSLPESAVYMTTNLGGVPIRLLGVHTISPGTAGRVAYRDSELAGMAQWMRRSPGATIMFGDFNVTYYSPKFKDLLHDGDATTSQLGFGIQATWPRQVRLAGIDIDQSVYRGPITAVARRRGPSLGSEHRALIVTYALTAGHGR